MDIITHIINNNITHKPNEIPIDTRFFIGIEVGCTHTSDSNTKVTILIVYVYLLLAIRTVLIPHRPLTTDSRCLMNFFVSSSS
jgi:hypothetical protein